jgi:hypothetical protein
MGWVPGFSPLTCVAGLRLGRKFHLETRLNIGALNESDSIGKAAV